MSLAEAPLPSTVTTPVAGAPEPALAPAPAPVPFPAPAGPRPRHDGLSQGAGRAIAGAFALAWILCPAIEPLPTGHHVPEYPLWQAPIDLAAMVSIVAAVVVLWRGGRTGARLGALAGALMAIETIICPIAGHTPVGWWTWAQTGLSLFVLGTSALLMSGRGARPAS